MKANMGLARDASSMVGTLTVHVNVVPSTERLPNPAATRVDLQA